MHRRNVFADIFVVVGGAVFVVALVRLKLIKGIMSKWFGIVCIIVEHIEDITHKYYIVYTKKQYYNIFLLLLLLNVVCIFTNNIFKSNLKRS